MAVLDRFHFLAKRFVAGETIASAIAAVRRLNAQGMSATLDFLGEDVFEREAASATCDTYAAMLDAIRESGVKTNVSIKLTAIGLRIDEDFALDNLTRILDYATRNADPFVRIDMEGSAVVDATLRVFASAYAKNKNVGIVLQAYLKRTPADVERAIELNARVRLVKGAYSEPATIAIKDMPTIRANFLAFAETLLLRGRYPGIATHDPSIVDSVKAFVAKHGVARDGFEFQMLYGCRAQLQRALVADGYRLRVYLPFGTHWAGYFYRRVLERRENALFALSALFGK